MSVTILTKDVGKVRDKIRPECECVRGLEDFNEDWIKREFWV